MFDFKKYSYDYTNKRLDVAGETMLFHCHHYNTFLQRSITDAEYIDSAPFLIGASAEAVYHQLSTLFRNENIDGSEDRAKTASELYRLSGFGLLDLGQLSESGGTIETSMSHYSFAWKEKFGTADKAIGFFTGGFIAGALAAIFDKEAGAYACAQTACRAKGDEKDIYEISAGNPNYTVFSKEKACLETFNSIDEPETPVDREGIVKALTGMDILGNEEGLIPAFGVYLTRMYADYYNRISFAFEEAMVGMAGEQGIEVSKNLFIEAGHVCAFNTFGGIMTSPEWDGLILPSLKTKEDWVYAMTSAVNSLGWGHWQVKSCSEQAAEFIIFNDYESVGFKSMYGKAEHNISYLATGAAAGIMNLVYFGDVASKPAFTPEFYNKLFKSNDSYQFEAHECSAKGDDFTRILVKK
jgi:hypothetical protein